jgi:hypothetical protein
MDKPEKFEMVGDIAITRPIAQLSWEQAVQLVASAIASARQQNIQKLMIVTLGLTGFESPSLAARYFFIQELAKAGSWGVRVAIVAKPQMIDSQKFGITVAANAGILADIFKTEEEALAWLRK